MISKQENLVYNLMVNATVLTAVAGVVTLIANNLTRIPPNIYIGFFATLALILTVVAYISQRRGHTNGTQILSFYAGIVLGLAVFAGGHFYDVATFIPDLILIWIAGLILLAFLFGNRWQMGLVGVLNLAWLSIAFLYNLSLWPGLIIIACVYWFAWQLRESVALFVLAVINTVLIVNLYGYDLMHPNHFPLTFATIHLLLTFAFFGMTSGLAGITRRNIPPWSSWLSYSRALIWMTTIAGIATLLLLTVPGNWITLAHSYDGSVIGIVLGMALYMTGAVFVFSRPTMPGTRGRFLLWAVGFLLLVSGLNDQMMPFTAQGYLSLMVSILGMSVGLGLLWSAIQRRCIVRLTLGLMTLFVSTGMVMTQWISSYMISAMLLLALAMIMMMFILRLRAKSRGVATTPSVSVGNRLVGGATS